MIRPRATNRAGNRAGSRVRAKVTSHRSRPKKAAPTPSQFGRGLCGTCKEWKPLLSSGKLRGHSMYGVICLGAHTEPISTEGA